MPKNKNKSNKAMFLFAWLFLSLIVLSALSIFIGSANIAIEDILKSIFFIGKDNDISNTIVWDIRMPRLALAILSGASLASAGCLMQSLFRNRLADPSITGVSSGAAVGAVIYISLFPQFPMGIQIFAFCFGMLSYALVWKLGRIDGRISTLSLLLAGIAVNAFCAALVAFFMYSVRESGLRGFIFWTLGSLNFASWKEIIPASIFSAILFITMVAKSKSLNLLLLGSNQAYYSGVNVARVEFLTAFCAASLTAICVALCGMIGFVGLIIPHMIRLLIGPENKKLLILSALAGANLIIVSDLISRIYSPTDPLPIGVITAFIGAPFFAYILKKCSN